MTSSQIEVLYALYEKQGSAPPKYEPVTGVADLALETALRSADTLPLVESFGDVADQIAALDAHVQSVPFDFPVNGHVVAFDLRSDTRWDPVQKTWVKVLLGGAISYPVVPLGEDPGNARLHLAVRTKNAVGEPGDAALAIA
jgi:hypothetical protein